MAEGLTSEELARNLFKIVLGTPHSYEISTTYPYKTYFPHDDKANVLLNFQGWKYQSDTVGGWTVTPFQCPKDLKSICIATREYLQGRAKANTYFVYDPEKIDVVEITAETGAGGFLVPLSRRITGFEKNGYEMIIVDGDKAFLRKRKQFAVSDVPQNILATPSLSSLIPKEFILHAGK